MQIPYLQIVALSVLAITYYRAGKNERSWAILWAFLSILLSLLALRLGFGMIGVFAGQVLLFVAITVYRMGTSGGKRTCYDPEKPNQTPEPTPPSGASSND